MLFSHRKVIRQNCPTSVAREFRASTVILRIENQTVRNMLVNCDQDYTHSDEENDESFYSRDILDVFAHELLPVVQRHPEASPTSLVCNARYSDNSSG